MFRQRFSRAGIVGIALFLLGPLISLAGGLLQLAADPLVGHPPMIGFVVMGFGLILVYVSLPLLLVGRVFVRVEG
jgi:hypothetical protein